MKRIMFNDFYGLTKAVIDGRKPVTRRICKEYATHQPILSRDVESFLFYPDENVVEFMMKDGTTKVSVPPYKNNEVVAVAQSYKDLKLSYIPHIDEPDFKTITKHAPQWGNPRGMKGWNNKMFVRPDLMPHQIQITGFNIERLQDISDEDCLREGVYYDEDVNGYKVTNLSLPNKGFRGDWLRQKYFFTPREAFAALINCPGVGHKGLWEENPYNFAYTFELLK